VHFIKMQGTGNDFIVMESGNIPRDWSHLATAMCDRHFGIGADGLLLVSPSATADFKMQIFNADGSEADACGNGLRCVAKYAAINGIIEPNSQRIMIETITGTRQTVFNRTAGEIAAIQVGMGRPRFAAAEIPVVIPPSEGRLVDINNMLSYQCSVEGQELTLNLISMGNPHAICFISHPVADFPLSGIGPQVENLPIFPQRANFEVAQVSSPQRIEARVWERGVGETLACGSGACAVAVAAQKHAYSGKNIDIILPGGAVTVDWDGSGEVYLGGPAEIVFTGEW